MNQDERRRYFRIEDTVGIRYELLTEPEARTREEELHTVDYHSPNRLQVTERHLQLLIDKLRIQNPEFAEAIDLLNTKFNILKEAQIDKELNSNKSSFIKKVSISACGLAFDTNDSIEVGQKLFMDITLLPTDLRVQTLAEVVGCEPSNERGHDWNIRCDFYGMHPEDEEMMVQHIVKRQGRLLAARRRNQERGQI
ncbi:MAG: PilZ domain-containing protein [Pseudomonadales bacterium]|nr:PilZ domain-containing protein [Pseudomonadales bacterium]